MTFVTNAYLSIVGILTVPVILLFSGLLYCVKDAFANPVDMFIRHKTRKATTPRTLGKNRFVVDPEGKGRRPDKTPFVRKDMFGSEFVKWFETHRYYGVLLGKDELNIDDMLTDLHAKLVTKYGECVTDPRFEVPFDTDEKRVREIRENVTPMNCNRSSTTDMHSDKGVPIRWAPSGYINVEILEVDESRISGLIGFLKSIHTWFGKK
jgi:hypothetical protein